MHITFGIEREEGGRQGRGAASTCTVLFTLLECLVFGECSKHPAVATTQNQDDTVAASSCQAVSLFEAPHKSVCADPAAGRADKLTLS